LRPLLGLGLHIFIKHIFLAVSLDYLLQDIIHSISNALGLLLPGDKGKPSSCLLYAYHTNKKQYRKGSSFEILQNGVISIRLTPN